MDSKCDQLNCMANLDGACVATKCRGKIAMVCKSQCEDKSALNKLYNLCADEFENKI